LWDNKSKVICSLGFCSVVLGKVCGRGFRLRPGQFVLKVGRRESEQLYSWAHPFHRWGKRSGTGKRLIVSVCFSLL
jgi:hypothetical protein